MDTADLDQIFALLDDAGVVATLPTPANVDNTVANNDSVDPSASIPSLILAAFGRNKPGVVRHCEACAWSMRLRRCYSKHSHAEIFECSLKRGCAGRSTLPWPYHNAVRTSTLLPVSPPCGVESSNAVRRTLRRAALLQLQLRRCTQQALQWRPLRHSDEHRHAAGIKKLELSPAWRSFPASMRCGRHMCCSAARRFSSRSSSNCSRSNLRMEHSMPLPLQQHSRMRCEKELH